MKDLCEENWRTDFAAENKQENQFCAKERFLFLGMFKIYQKVCSRKHLNLPLISF